MGTEKQERVTREQPRGQHGSLCAGSGEDRGKSPVEEERQETGKVSEAFEV